MVTSNYQQFCDLESYIFKDVHPKFQQQGFLNAFDFFCIIIWKANRAKSKIAKKLTEGGKEIEAQVKLLTQDIHAASTEKDKLRVLHGAPWKFRLPIASAILTVLYPKKFTVYDVRVCETLGCFEGLGNLINFDSIWTGYSQYKQKVEEIAPAHLSLRDKDRYLWGQSFHNQLEKDILKGFSKIS